MPMPNNMARGGRAPARLDANSKKIFSRLMRYLFVDHKGKFLFACVLIVVSALASVGGSMFLGIFVDQFISPLIGQADPDWSGFIGALCAMGGIYLAGVVCNYTYFRIMVVVAQGTMKRLRNEMFSHMQTLPLKFFDTHTHGTLMSRYTNDTDVLRQMLSQTIPQLINSTVTIVGTFCMMVFYSATLTLVAMIFVVGMFLFTQKLAKRSGGYFLQQQRALASVNGYIEEMMSGQRVVKVFNHEEKAKAAFRTLNEDLRVNATRANVLTNVIGPISNNIGYIQYIVVAFVQRHRAHLQQHRLYPVYHRGVCGSLPRHGGELVRALHLRLHAGPGRGIDAGRHRLLPQLRALLQYAHPAGHAAVQRHRAGVRGRRAHLRDARCRARG